jgi:hypothetical protein
MWNFTEIIINKKKSQNYVEYKIQKYSETSHEKWSIHVKWLFKLHEWTYLTHLEFIYLFTCCQWT